MRKSLARPAQLTSLLWILISASAVGAQDPATFLLPDADLEPIQLTPMLRNAVDIRWNDEKRVLIAGAGAGTRQIDLSARIYEDREHVGALPAFGPYGSHRRLAKTEEWIAASAISRAIFWRPAAAAPGVEPNVNEMSFDFIGDIDGRGDTLVILGARRDHNGAYSPNGVIGWRAKVTPQELLYTPFFVSSSGAGSHAMDLCGVMEPGKVRFLKDGSYIFVPGVESGIFVYSPKGRLVKTRESNEIDIDTGCDIDKETSTKYYASYALRETEWVNNRRILDEILPLRHGAGFVVRRLENGLVRWRLKILRSSGEVVEEEIPIASRSPYAHLKGDVLDDGGVVYLISDLDPEGVSPDEPIYLFVSKAALPPRREAN